VTGADLNIAVAGTHPDDYFTGGFLEFYYAEGGYNEIRMINNHTGTLIEMDDVIPTLVAGDTVRIYPGCDHSLATCDAKFSNSLNYGGFPFVPLINPFDGSPIFY